LIVPFLIENTDHSPLAILFLKLCYKYRPIDTLDRAIYIEEENYLGEH